MSKKPERIDMFNPWLKSPKIELPHYSFGRSVSEELRDGFVGRKKVLKKLKELVRNAGDKIGVYLVTGNRGVGKSELIEEVIRDTSWQSSFSAMLKHLFALFCAVAGTQFCLDDWHIGSFISFFASLFPKSVKDIILYGGDLSTTMFWFFMTQCVISLFFICYLNEYRRKKDGFLDWNFSVYKEILCLRHRFGSYRITRYLLRVIFIVGLTQIISWIVSITATKIFVLCLIPVFMVSFVILEVLEWFCLTIRRKKKRKKNGYDMSIGTECYKKVKNIRPWIVKVLKKIGNVVESHNRVYLRINFGHNLKDEKDILRLITRTLLTEYRRYHRSFWKRPVWRFVSIVFLFVFADLLGDVVKNIAKDPYLAQPNENRLYSKSDYIAYIEKTKESNLSHANNGMQVYIIKNFFGVDWAKKFISWVDTFISKESVEIENLFEYLWTGKKANKEGRPISYSFWLSFFFLYTCLVWLSRRRWLSRYFMTHRLIMQRIKNLNNDITYNTEREKSISIQSNANGNAKIGTNMKRSRGVADAREIERELQDIFQDIQRIPAFMGRPKFVIVFDELDKVEPGNINLEHVSQETKAALFSIEVARERQSEILKILSNMKYFLSTSEAKFIFIAGREMYDIYLADVSDRNNYIGSIFSAVFDVPSFLTDSAEEAIKADMTSLTEEFVCRRLFPRDYSVGDGSYNLESYRCYLKDEIYGERSKKMSKDEEERQIHKIIAMLQQFIIYLAHVSKGAPKKMTQLFESFIEVKELKEHKGDKHIIVQYYSRSKFFLSFGYYQQYAIGLLAYVVTPIFYRLVERNVSAHNDKLLVSSLRFVDFLFKFHKHSFSWKNLDISPEMLEVNRALELKKITGDLLNFILQRFVNKSNFSIFDYRFDNRIANEIFAAAKTDQVFSALFSFSLDETLSLKEHYKNLLAKTMEKYKTEKSVPSEDVIDSVSSLQVVLGDLYYFDDQLEEAGIYYRDAIEALRKKGSRTDDDKNKESGYRNSEENRMLHRDNDMMKPEQLYLFVRNMLKVGMIYEIRKQYEQAYLIYSEICMRVIRERDIAIRELGVGLAIRKAPCGRTLFVKISEVEKIERSEEMYNDNVEYPTLKNCRGIERVNRKIAQPQPMCFEKLSPNTNDMLFRKMTYEGLKLLYLPFLVKLQILEKSHMGGIARSHLEQLEKEIDHLTFIIDHEEAHILMADFYSHLADIIYYKNADLKDKKLANRMCEKDESKYNQNESPKSEMSGPPNASCSACYYYHKALATLLNKDKKSQKQCGRDKLGLSLNCIYNNEDYKEQEDAEIKGNNAVMKLLIDCVNIIGNDKYYNMKHGSTLARILSDWGNVFLACDRVKEVDPKNDVCYIGDTRIRNEKEQPTVSWFRVLCFNYVNLDDPKPSKDCTEKLLGVLNEKNKNITKHDYSKQEIAFLMYALSFQAFRRVSGENRAAYQLYKMLRLLKRYENYNHNEETLKKLSKNAIGLLWHAADELNDVELNKRKSDFGKKTRNEKPPLRYLLVDSEVSIMAILIQELKLRAAVDKYDLDKRQGKLIEELKKIYEYHIASQYGIIYSFSARIFQLRLKADINYMTYRNVLLSGKIGSARKEVEFILESNHVHGIKEIFGEYKNSKYKKDETYYVKYVFAKLVSESIFCLKDLIRLSKTLDETYLFNHSFMGGIHERLSFWIKRYEASKEYCEERKRLNNNINGIESIVKQMDESLRYFRIDANREEQLSSHYETQQALSHYHKCMETHAEGKAYHTMIDNMYFVKDDYSDRSDHFSIAIERHKIINGVKDLRKRKCAGLNSICDSQAGMTDITDITDIADISDIKEKILRLEKACMGSKVYNTKEYFNMRECRNAVV